KAYGDIDAQGFDFFYQPKPLLYRGLRFKTPAQKRTNIFVACDRLARGLLQAQNQGQTIQWVIHGDGLSLFEKALDRLNGQTLDKHQVLIAGLPKQQLGSVIQKMRGHGIQFHNDVIKYNGHDWSALNNRVWGMKRMYQAIESLGDGYQDRLGELKDQARDDRFKAISGSAGALSNGFLAGSLITGSMGSDTLMAAGLTSTAYGLYAFTHKLRSLRNITANKLDNAGLNPHMHPFKSTARFNSQVERTYGSQAQSFLALVGYKRGNV
ncbi:hypothetical protein, partial [Endozoicomonas numazuensis]